MCVIMLLALGATAYLAVFFNRRAKADLQAALDPLAAAIDGTVNLDEAEVAGRWEGWPVYARMANASEGPGRVFHVDIVDAAGGEGWQYTSNPVSKSQPTPTVTFAGPAPLRETVEHHIDTHANAFLDPDHERFRVEYMVDQGFVRLIRSMRTRRDIPTVETFTAELAMLAGIANANRAFIESTRDMRELGP